MNQILFYVFYFLAQLLRLYSYVMVARAIMSWFVSPYSKVYRIVRVITEPFVSLFRPLSNKITGNGRGMPIDLAFLFAMIALQLLAGLVDWCRTTLTLFL